MPLDVLVNALNNVIPSDTTAFFPEFSTSTPRSLHAFRAAFCDMCSPYYNYCMYLCDIPKINVQGSHDEWKNLLDNWEKLPLKASTWTKLVSKILTDLVSNFNSEEFWKSIFAVKRCGSGGQVEVIGWFQNLFRIIPRVKYVENFANHVSIINYKQIDLNTKYTMSVGLFTSRLEDDCMIPNFGFVVHELLT